MVQTYNLRTVDNINKVKVIPLGVRNNWQQRYNSTILYRAVARSENPGRLVVLGGDNVSPSVSSVVEV